MVERVRVGALLGADVNMTVPDVIRSMDDRSIRSMDDGSVAGCSMAGCSVAGCSMAGCSMAGNRRFMPGFRMRSRGAADSEACHDQRNEQGAEKPFHLLLLAPGGSPCQAGTLTLS